MKTLRYKPTGISIKELHDFLKANDVYDNYNLFRAVGDKTIVIYSYSWNEMRAREHQRQKLKEQTDQDLKDNFKDKWRGK